MLIKRFISGISGVYLVSSENLLPKLCSYLLDLLQDVHSGLVQDLQHSDVSQRFHRLNGRKSTS